MELSKSDKRVARTIIDKGLQREFANGLEELWNILNQWKGKGADTKETYYTLFKQVKDFDKNIARRYDEMRGSFYLFIIAAQLNEELIDENDLKGLSGEAQDAIRKMISMRIDRKNDNS